MSDNNMASSIFQDLEIDTSDMMDDPEAFVKRVHAKATELEEILKKDTSVRAYESEMKAHSHATNLPDEFKKMFNDIYMEAENLTIPEIVLLIEQSRKFTRELEDMFHNRCVYASASKGSPLADKRIAHYQHTRLRQNFDSYVNFAKVWMKKDFKRIKGLQGNYGSGLSPVKTYVYYIGKDEYMNHRAVQKQLGIECETLMDFLNYLENNETNVVVKEVTF